MIKDLRKITGDTSISNSDKLYTIKLSDYHYITFYETRSDYLYVVETKHGQIIEVSTYEYLNTKVTE